MAKVETGFEIKLSACFEEEQIQELFEDREVKFSQAKMKKLKKLLIERLEEDPAILEEFLQEQMDEIIQDEWER